MSQPNEPISTNLDDLRPGTREGYAARYNRRRSSLVLRSHQQDWERLIIGVAWGGGVYPICVVACMSPFFLYSMLVYGSSGALASGAASIAIGLSMGFLFGFVYALFVSIPVSGCTALGCWLLDWRPLPVGRGAFTGALTAYLCTLPASLEVFQYGLLDGLSQATNLCFFIAVGPGLACFVGQVFGARSGLVNATYQTFNARTTKQTDSESATSNHPQFRIRQMLGLTALLSLLLTLLRMTGLLTLPMMLATMVWFAVQVMGQRPAIALAKRLLRRRGRGFVRQPRGLVAQHY